MESPESPEGSFRIVSMIPDDGREPPSSLNDADASAMWLAVSAPWHPALLAIADDLPAFDDVAMPRDPEPGEVRLVAAGHLNRLPPTYLLLAEVAGVPIVEASLDRLETVRLLLELRSVAPVNLEDPVARDYLALGSSHWWLRDLTIAMGHVDTLSRPTLAREVLAGARAWRDGDAAGATNRLRAGFELLSQARERFYPMDGYILDLCLLDPSTAPDALAEIFEHRTPVTLIAPAKAIDVFATREPERAAELREAITDGWADVVGGAWAEVDEPLLSWSSIAWQFRKGSESYREHLDDRTVETLARRRFGLYPQLPQIARRFGFRYALFFALDSGRFPLTPESKRLWGSPDGTTLESMTRIPIAADRASEGAKLAWRMGKAMKEDSSATLGFAHWPGLVADWFADFRRSAAYSAVLARWVTVNDYFNRSDRPFDEVLPEIDDYASAYLTQAAARRDPSPIAARAEHTSLRATADALISIHALASALAGAERPPIDVSFEEKIETGRGQEVRLPLRMALHNESDALASLILGDRIGPPGFLVINPLGVARRVAVGLSDDELDLRPDGPLRSSQITEDGVMAVVDLPPFGFAWIPSTTNPDARPSPTAGVTLRDRTLRNETVQVAIDPGTGGIRGLQLISEETPRIAQQLVINGLVGVDGKPATSKMKCESYHADYAGPTFAQARTIGTLHDPRDDRQLARFRQVVRVYHGRPTVEIEVNLDEVDPTWLASIAGSDPWTHHLACRWAWPDGQSTLRRTSMLAPMATTAERPETPDAIDITSRQRRTTLLFAGLAHHKRAGARMIDTILVAGSEVGRKFQMGVTLDLENPFPAILDMTAPGLVVSTNAGPPASGPTGWLVQIDNKSVAILRLAFEPLANEGKGWGIIVDLIETSGKAARCRLRAFRDPVKARQVDGRGNHVVDLPRDGDAALVDLTPYEIARVELTLAELDSPSFEAYQSTD